MSRRTALARLGRTLRHLEPSQILSRAAEPAVDALDRRGPGVVEPVSAPGWPETFVPMDARLCSAHVGPMGQDITLLGATRTMGPPAAWDWTAPDAPRLWRFHLNYWDWAHELTTRPGGRDVLEELVTGWVSRTRYGVGDEWEPYVVSLRLWNLCALHEPARDPVGGSALVRSVVQQQHHLSRRLEWDIRGNHLLKNLKALCGTAAFLGQDQRLHTELDRAYEQITRQVLSDGGHEERSPSYHAQVLQDVVDLSNLARSQDQLAAADDLARVATRMSDWLRAMNVGGALPALNDGFPVSPGLLELLDVTSPASLGNVTLLAESGYVRVRVGSWDHLMDVGPLGPSHNPGHGHADSLSFLAWYDGAPLLVDTGTSTYAAGERRAYERSTRAHNTVEVAGCDSSEVWGSFRVGRRAKSSLTTVGSESGRVEVSASHDGYDATHRVGTKRTWTALPDRLVVVDDLHVRPGAATPVAITHLHLHPAYRWTGNEAIGPSGTFTITCQDRRGQSVSAHPSTGPVAEGLDHATDGVHLQFRWPKGATGVTTTIRVDSAIETQRESS